MGVIVMENEAEHWHSEFGGGGQREKAAWEVINSSDIDGGPSRYQFL